MPRLSRVFHDRTNPEDNSVKGLTTDHPQNGARQLFKLVGAAPAGLDCSETEVTDLHRQILVEENIWGRGQGNTPPFSNFELLKVGLLGTEDGGHIFIPPSSDDCNLTWS